MLIYLDQNVVGYVHAGRLRFRDIDNVTWVYSNEHFAEIARGDDRRLLGVLGDLRARQIEVVLDDNFRITNRAHLHEYSCPFERFEQYQETVQSVPFDNAPALDLLARFFGADNFDLVRNVPERMHDQMIGLFEQVGTSSGHLEDRWNEAGSDLQHLIDTELQETRPLTLARRELGTTNASDTEQADNPIVTIWNMIGARFDGVCIDQFFGFDPVDKQGYDEWPTYLGIISCHAALNLIGFRPDKGLSAVSALPRIMSDGTHIAHAAFCGALISGDRRLSAKARAIYRYKSISTQVLRVIVASPQG